MHRLNRERIKLLLSVMAVSLVQTTWGDPPSLNPIAPTSSDPTWRVGPTRVDLGKNAVLDVPQGYRFTDQLGARTLLQRMKNPASANLIGLLAPDTGRWWIALEYSEVGYLKNLDQGLDPAKALEGVQQKVEKENEARVNAGAATVGAVKWAIAPRFDAKNHTLEWALEAQTPTDKVINHTIRLLGRKGVLDATAVQSENADYTPIPLNDLVAGMAFKAGEAYEDYRAGDAVATLSLTDLIVGNDQPSNSKVVVGAGIWAGVVFLACAVAGVAMVLRRKYLQLKEADTIPVLSGGNGSGPNGRTRVSRNGSGERRKMFNYQKFYSDMMLQVSGGSSIVGHQAAIGVHRVNGSDGTQSANGKSPLPALDTEGNQAIYRANMTLIASQTHLIEEQKKLLQEQSKLIEEKTKLIREKNEVLEKQAELFQLEPR